MKLKKWLKEYKNMSYGEYKSMEWGRERGDLWSEFCDFNRRALLKAFHDKQGWRPMTDEEKKHYERVFQKESERRDMNLKCGGINENGNYIALHYRSDQQYDQMIRADIRMYWESVGILPKCEEHANG